VAPRFLLLKYLLMSQIFIPRTAVVGAHTKLVLESVKHAESNSLIDAVLIGNGEKIKKIARDMDFDVANKIIIDAKNDEEGVKKMVELIKDGSVEMVMKGCISSDLFLNQLLASKNGLKTNRRASHIFRLDLPGSKKDLYVTDAVLNVETTEEVLYEIANNAIEILQSLDIKKPKIAVLSATEKITTSVPSSTIIDSVVMKLRNKKNVVVEGPVALDVALSKDAVLEKGIKSKVAGEIDLLVFPNIEAGNIFYKALVFYVGATPAGIVTGLKVPVILTSRADTIEARVASCYFARQVFSAKMQ